MSERQLARRSMWSTTSALLNTELYSLPNFFMDPHPFDVSQHAFTTNFCLDYSCNTLLLLCLLDIPLCAALYLRSNHFPNSENGHYPHRPLPIQTRRDGDYDQRGRLSTLNLSSIAHDRSHNRPVDFTALPCAKGFLHSPNCTKAIYHFLDWWHQ